MIRIATIAITALIIVLLLSSCTTNWIYREFTSTATNHEGETIFMGPTWLTITFSNGQYALTNIDWITFQKEYKGKCVHVVSRERVDDIGPTGLPWIHKIEKVPCDQVSNKVEVWGTWEEKT